MAVGWGVIGIGKLADIAVAPAIARQGDSRLIAVCSRDQGRAERFAESHNADRSYTDLAQMLEDPAVDVVYIATPNSLHADQVCQAAAARKHVLVEKPMALSVEDGERMVAAAEAADVLLGVGFHLRHKAANRRARDAVASGRLGRVFFAEIAVGAGKGVYPYDTWRADPVLAGGGTLLHQGTHAIDLLGFLTQQRIVAVASMVDHDPHEDVFAATCRLDGGVLAQLSSHQLHPGTRPDWVVLGEDGWLEGHGTTHPFPGDEIVLHSGSEVIPLGTSARSAYDEEVDAFAEAVVHGAPLSGSGADGLRNIAVCEALYRSVRERRTVDVAGS